MTKQNLPLSKKIIYSLGQFGWSLASFGVANLITYFYMAPETGGKSEFPVLIFQGAVFGVLTIIGLANFAGRIFDGITDPIIAGLSDRSRSRFGRRRFFLMISAVPLALLSVLVFMTPQGKPGPVNSIWLVSTIILFYLFLTMYIMPYGALIAELGHTSKERTLLSTLVAVTWSLGFLIGNTIYALKGVFQSMGLNAVASFRLTIALYAAISLIAMLMPVFFIDERKYGLGKVSEQSTMKALKSAFSNRDFLFFTISDFFYFIANTFLEIGIVYYVTILLGLPEAMTTLLMTVLFLGAFAFYPLVVKAADKLGKRTLMVGAFIGQSFTFFLISSSGGWNQSMGVFWGWLLIVVQIVPVAIFSILPTAIIADIARADGIQSGNHKEGMFFGARSFSMKLAISITNLVFPSLLLLGKSVENPAGVRMTAVFALIVNVLGMVFMLFYREKNIIKVLVREEPELRGKLEKMHGPGKLVIQQEQQ